jgi:hypothetical protein
LLNLVVKKGIVIRVWGWKNWEHVGIRGTMRVSSKGLLLWHLLICPVGLLYIRMEDWNGYVFFWFKFVCLDIFLSQILHFDCP